MFFSKFFFVVRRAGERNSVSMISSVWRSSPSSSGNGILWAKASFMATVRTPFGWSGRIMRSRQKSRKSVRMSSALNSVRSSAVNISLRFEMLSVRIASSISSVCFVVSHVLSSSGRWVIAHAALSDVRLSSSKSSWKSSSLFSDWPRARISLMPMRPFRMFLSLVVITAYLPVRSWSRKKSCPEPTSK